MRTVISLLCFISSLLSAAAPPPVSQKKLDHTVARWQAVLQLQDWHVFVRAARIDELTPGTAGDSGTFTSTQRVMIRVLDPRDYAELSRREGTPVKVGRAVWEDIEDTIVHELVHLRLWQFKKATAANLDGAEELTVVRFTTALLKKGKR